MGLIFAFLPVHGVRCVPRLERENNMKKEVKERWKNKKYNR